MSTLRLCTTIAVLFVAGFLGGQWLLTVQPARPDPRLPSFHHIDPDSERTKLERSSLSDDDQVRDRLRNNLLDYAKALADDPCNGLLKAHYIEAVTAYVRAWTAIAPCLAIRACTGWSAERLERARRAFGTPLDHRVRDAMMAAHRKATFGSGDFPQDTVSLAADLAADESLNAAHDTREFRRVSSQFGDASGHQDCGR
jgi:hypothetical protein